MKHIVVYRCQQCGGRQKLFKESWLREFVLTCTGQLEPIHILRAFEDGEFGVCVVHCEPSACRTLAGARQALRHVKYARQLLGEVAINPERVKTICFQPAGDLHLELNRFLDHLKHLEEHGSAPAPAALEREKT
ncbi:MAG: hydrogenase iron-sulfur subunit [Kiritimatiellia bacterium]|nr:hydrogenase iron-sulfur subunit [Kiritimatiellia bacterium]